MFVLLGVKRSIINTYVFQFRSDSPERRMTMSIKEFAAKFCKAEEDAWQNENFDALEALEDPNVVYHIGEMDIIGFEAHKRDIMTQR